MNAPPADPRYVAARRVLLDALVALEPLTDAIVVAGAQAIYLRTGHGELAVAPYTTDGDLAIDPALLGDEPLIEEAMRAAGLRPSLCDDVVEPGVWVASVDVAGETVSVPVDLIVPEHVASRKGRRGARLGVHGKRAARRAIGLEAVLVDHALLAIRALDPSDARVIEAKVAGEAGLLVAKVHKLHDRVERGRAARIRDKDAADVIRLMQSTEARAIGGRLSVLCEDPVAGRVSERALELLDELFGRRGRPGVEMATRALRLAMPADTVEALCVAYTRALVAAIR